MAFLHPPFAASVLVGTPAFRFDQRADRSGRPAEIRLASPPPPADRLFRLDLLLMAGAPEHRFSPAPSYLVRAGSAREAWELAKARAIDSYPQARDLELLRCWSYPRGPLVLHGAATLEPGDPVDVADVI
ncbi:MAG: hypothetical protein AUG49_16025 [Catenulispora sp. 13_1_20CM_3_70_7]|nr:MAG: hypothetical protein AUG49_16025 [Catenulispora sp. 13_1_20CM_3_70_7]